MDEGRKRVIGIMAAILASLHMQSADDLFGTPQGSPRTDKLISAGVRHFSLLRSGLRRTETAPCGDSIAGHFSKSVRSGAPPAG
jgi:hypothetical protein